ncbi:MAG TPA: efflux RND transporter periplasmic adaptor subunit [Candidatus Sulfotelmatobacter sp.]|nr:efflux RND transporter periplasmic adaptor subunit [Candidatus Sulfotelmatobacter sp.]
MLRIAIVAGSVSLAAGGLVGWYSLQADAEATAPQQASAPAIPVETATVARGSLPVYLTGLGTVQAFNTVTVRSRVDGELQKVAFTEGQTVKAGDVLAQIDPRPFQAALDQAVAKQAQDRAQLADARLNLQRFRALGLKEFATRQSIDTQAALVSQLEAQVEGDQAAIESARVQLGYATITSPLDGRVGIRLVDQGNIVHATDTGGLVVITQLQPISVIVTLPEADVPGLQAALARGPVQAVAFSQDAHETSGQHALDRGTVALLDNEIDQTSGTIRLKATFPNTKQTLWPGQFVSVRVLERTDAGVVTVPDRAIQHVTDGLYVYVVKPDGTVERRDVTAGEDGDGRLEITQGLAPGEQVVTAGQYRLQPGVHVTVETARINSTATGQGGAAS